MEIAYEHGIETIAFPAISTGVYGYPLDDAAPLALRTVIDYVAQHDGFRLVRFVLFDTAAQQAFAGALERLIGEKEDLHLV
jgi:O-acetyl-ADP-ribose deacetylase (regulator of RNase III)